MRTVETDRRVWNITRMLWHDNDWWVGRRSGEVVLLHDITRLLDMAGSGRVMPRIIDSLWTGHLSAFTCVTVSRTSYEGLYFVANLMSSSIVRIKSSLASPTPCSVAHLISSWIVTMEGKCLPPIWALYLSCISSQHKSITVDEFWWSANKADQFCAFIYPRNMMAVHHPLRKTILHYQPPSYHPSTQQIHQTTDLDRRHDGRNQDQANSDQDPEDKSDRNVRSKFPTSTSTFTCTSTGDW